MFIPKKTKYKKSHKIFNSVVSKPFDLLKLKFGSVGLKSLSSGRLTSKQIESFKQSIMKSVKKHGVLKLNLFASIPVTKKPLEVRMGKGKGGVNHWVCGVDPGVLICELETSSAAIALNALKIAQYRLPIKTEIITI